MIDYMQGEKGTIDGKPIVRWEVRFVNMRGYHKTLAEALLDSAVTNQPPELIQTACVAVAEDGSWEPH